MSESERGLLAAEVEQTVRLLKMVAERLLEGEKASIVNDALAKASARLEMHRRAIRRVGISEDEAQRAL